MMGLVLREAAECDIEGSFDHYLAAAGGEVATAFALAVDAALRIVPNFQARDRPAVANYSTHPAYVSGW